MPALSHHTGSSFACGVISRTISVPQHSGVKVAFATEDNEMLSDCEEEQTRSGWTKKTTLW
jgi:hypothetical protein